MVKQKGGLALGEHGHMDVRCASGVGLWPDGAKAIAAGIIGQRMTEALKIRIKLGAPLFAWVPVATIGITLPDFDAHPGKCLTVAIQDASSEIADLSTGL